MEGLSHRGALPRFLDKGRLYFFTSLVPDIFVVPEAAVGAQMLD